MPDGKAGLRAVLPAGTVERAFRIGKAVGTIVVNDHLVHLDIPLPGQEDIGPGILQHRHQVGQGEGGREQVLDRLEHPGALPFPTVQRGFVIPAVTVPEGNIAIVQPGGGDQRLAHIAYQRLAADIAFRHARAVVGRRLAAVVVGHQLFDRPFTGIEGEPIVAVAFPQPFAQLAVDPGNPVFPEGQGHEGLAEVHLQPAAGGIDAHAVDLAAGMEPYRQALADALLEEHIDGFINLDSRFIHPGKIVDRTVPEPLAGAAGDQPKQE